MVLGTVIREKGIFEMKNVKKTIAGISALSMAMSLAACGGSSEEQTEVMTQETTTQATVEINTATLAEDDQQTLDDVAAEYLRDVELENKTIKWLAHYDITVSYTHLTLPTILLV